MHYQLVVWDFDGTLADSWASTLATYNRLAPRFGSLPVADPAAVRGMSTREFLKVHRISWLRLPALLRRFLAEQRDEMQAVRLFPGVRGVLDRLHRCGVPQGILSSNVTDNISACLNANEIDHLFTFVTGYPRLFGKARALTKMLRQKNLRGADVLYVGDEVRDVEAARQAGVDVAAVAWGFNDTDRLRQAGPSFLVSEPADLLPLVVECHCGEPVSRLS
jgi:phosphoglycolate phosphatase